ESEGPKVIVKIFEHRILEERRVLRIWHVPDRLSLIEFARLRHPRIDLFPRGQVYRRPGVHTLESFDLGRGETCRVVGTGAEQTLGLKLAAPRVVDLAVHKTVQVVAGRYYRLEDRRQLADRDCVRAGGILMIALPGPDVPGAQLEHPEDRRASDDASGAGGVPLRLHERLPAASRAPVEVGTLGIGSVEAVYDRFGLQRELVNRSISVVLDLLRVGPPGIARGVGAMPRVRRGCSVVTTDRGLHVREADRSGQAAVADFLEFPVPVHRRHPDLEEDRWRYDPSHPADRKRDVTDGRRVLAGRQRLDQHDGRFG